MSHVTDVKLKIRDLEALKDAAKECGLEFRENQLTYAWWGTFVGDSRAYGQHDPKQFGKCEHALRIPGDKPVNGHSGPWEIGVVKARDGDGFDLLYDTYGGAGSRLTARVGTGASTLRREYAVATATRKAQATLARRGFQTVRENLPGNRVKIKLRKR